MIVGIRGVLEGKGDGWVHLNVGGVILQVMVPPSILGEIGAPGERAHLHTHLMVRDNEAVLYGFATTSELTLFQMLLTVSGVGPRTALALLSFLGAQSLVGAIASGSEQVLSQVTGVGKKNAARIVLELKGKLGLHQTDQVGDVGDHQAAIAALTALGYTASEANQALVSMAGDPGLPLEEKLRQALQHLAGAP